MTAPAMAVVCSLNGRLVTLSVLIGIAGPVSPAVSISTLGIATVSVLVLGFAVLTWLANRLSRQRALLDELFEQAPAAVVLLDGQSRVVRANREFTKLFGYTPEEARGHRLN